MVGPTPIQPPAGQPGDPEVAPPYANKAIAVVVTFIVGGLVQWAATKGLDLGEEGTTGIVGVITAFLVFQISNYKRKGV